MPCRSAYFAVARLENLEQIENLRAYFCKVLIREIHRERGQLGAALVDDFPRSRRRTTTPWADRPASPPAVERCGLRLTAGSGLARALRRPARPPPGRGAGPLD